MSALLGDSKAEIYFGVGEAPIIPPAVFWKGSTVCNAADPSAVTLPANIEGDLIVLHVGVTSLTLPPTPAGFTVYKSASFAGSPNNTSAIFYRYAPAGGLAPFTLTGLTNPGGWGCYVFENVHPTSPFGGYGVQIAPPITTANATAPAIAKTVTNGTSLVVYGYGPMYPNGLIYGAPSVAQFSRIAAEPSLTALSTFGGYIDNDRTSPTGIGYILGTETGNRNGGFGFSYEILAGPGRPTPPLATAVYWNNTRVWPDFTPVGPTRYTTSTTVQIPRGCRSIDVVTIGGGGGANYTGVFSNGVGGRAGAWGSTTLEFNRDFRPGQDAIVVSVGTVGAGGQGGILTLPLGTAGQQSVAAVNGTGASVASNGGGGGGAATAAGQTPTALVFNGNTYTGGAGGVNGGAGQVPGGGGGGGAGGLTGLNGGNGGTGAVWLYFY